MTDEEAALKIAAYLDSLNSSHQKPPKPFDVVTIPIVLQTSGGDADAAFLITKTIRNHAKKVSVCVPFFAKSAGTMICLGANEIILFQRRFTRLTSGFSKKLENLKYSVALFIAHFNFCRVHSAHGQTPAMAAELTNHIWTIEEIFSSTLF